MPTIVPSILGSTLIFTTTEEGSYNVTVGNETRPLTKTIPLVFNNIQDSLHVILTNSNSVEIGRYTVANVRAGIFASKNLIMATSASEALTINSVVDMIIGTPSVTLYELTSSNTWTPSSATFNVNEIFLDLGTDRYVGTVTGLTTGTLYKVSASAIDANNTTYTIPFVKPTPDINSGVLSVGKIDLTLATSTEFSLCSVSLFTDPSGSTPATNADGSNLVVTAAISNTATTVTIVGLTNETPYYVRTSYIYNGLSAGLSNVYGPYTPSTTRTVVTNAILLDGGIFLKVNTTGITGNNLRVSAHVFTDEACTQRVTGITVIPAILESADSYSVAITQLAVETPYYVKAYIQDTYNNIIFAESFVNGPHRLKTEYKTAITAVETSADLLVATVDYSAIPGSSTPSNGPPSIVSSLTISIDVYDQGNLIYTAHQDNNDNKQFCYVRIRDLSQNVNYMLQAYINTKNNSITNKQSLSILSGPHSLNSSHIIPQVTAVTVVKSGASAIINWNYNDTQIHDTLIALSSTGADSLQGVRFLSDVSSTVYTFGPTGNMPYGTYMAIAVYTIGSIPYSIAARSELFNISDAVATNKAVTTIIPSVNGDTVTASLTYSSDIVGTDEIIVGIATAANMDNVDPIYLTTITAASSTKTFTFPYTAGGSTLPYGTYYLVTAYTANGTNPTQLPPLFSEAFTVSAADISASLIYRPAFSSSAKLSLDYIVSPYPSSVPTVVVTKNDVIDTTVIASFSPTAFGAYLEITNCLPLTQYKITVSAPGYQTVSVTVTSKADIQMIVTENTNSKTDTQLVFDVSGPLLNSIQTSVTKYGQTDATVTVTKELVLVRSTRITLTNCFPNTTYSLIVSAPGYSTISISATTNIGTAQAPVCFLADAPVLTPSGYRPIASVKMGDKVLTADGRLVTVRSIYVKRYAASSATNPYVIPKGHLGATESLPISPNHEVLVPGRGMIKAKHLGLRQMTMPKPFMYYNLELDDWILDNMVVAGVTVESLAPTKRITMSREEYADFVYKRYGTPTAESLARIKQVFYRLEDGRVSAPVFAAK